MSIRSVLVVVLALVFGGSAAIGINTLRPAPTADPVETVTVLVASEEIARGKTITSNLVRQREYPKDLVPAGALSRPEEALDRTTIVLVAADEPILEAKLASRAAGRGLAPLVPEGMRACTITTNVASSVAGFILPGNHVDVLLTVTGSKAADAAGGGSTTTLLQNVEILAVDHKVEAASENVKGADPNLRSVTLLVNQSQAAKLALGQSRGTLQLTLRNPNDQGATDARPATLTEIQFHQEKPWEDRVKEMMEAAGKALAANANPPTPAKAPEPAPPAQIRTLRGTQDGIVTVQPTEPRAKGQ